MPFRNMLFPVTFRSISKAFLLIFILISIFVISYTLIQCIFSNFKNNRSTSSWLEPHFGAVFQKLDSNKDGQLSFSEFSAVNFFYKITVIENVCKEDLIDDVELAVNPDSQVITITALFKPLDLESLSKDVQSISHEHLGSLEGLLKWTLPFKHQQNFTADMFSLFLPPENEQIFPGSTWWVVKPIHSMHMGQMPSTKYFPPVVEPKFRPLVALLKMFHPYPFLWTRYAPQGTVAVLHAVHEDFVDILFRVHAEFQLNEPPRFPFWFTPSQFAGRLIINRNATVVRYFQLQVPNQRKLNVDMEWLNSPEEDSMEVDIGYLPEMTLLFSDSLYERHKSQDDLLCDFSSDICNSEILNKIDMEDAVDRIESQLFPFKQVKYHNLTNAFHIAEIESKLVHGVLLWGALDDQSC